MFITFNLWKHFFKIFINFDTLLQRGMFSQHYVHLQHIEIFNYTVMSELQTHFEKTIFTEILLHMLYC